jgi:hypothetical protein
MDLIVKCNREGIRKDLLKRDEYMSKKNSKKNQGKRRSDEQLDKSDDDQIGNDQRSMSNLDNFDDDASMREGSQYGGRMSSLMMPSKKLTVEERVDRIDAEMDDIERDIYGHIHDDYDRLSRGYSTISSTVSEGNKEERETNIKEINERILKD